MAWIGGWYYVRSTTTKGNFFQKEFKSEQEARTFGNEQWKKPYVVSVIIVKMGFDGKKRRKATTIAEANKE